MSRSLSVSRPASARRGRGPAGLWQAAGELPVLLQAQCRGAPLAPTPLSAKVGDGRRIRVAPGATHKQLQRNTGVEHTHPSCPSCAAVKLNQRASDTAASVAAPANATVCPKPSPQLSTQRPVIASKGWARTESSDLKTHSASTATATYTSCVTVSGGTLAGKRTRRESTHRSANSLPRRNPRAATVRAALTELLATSPERSWPSSSASRGKEEARGTHQRPRPLLVRGLRVHKHLRRALRSPVPLGTARSQERHPAVCRRRSAGMWQMATRLATKAREQRAASRRGA